jgi:hypothetical protein
MELSSIIFCLKRACFGSVAVFGNDNDSHTDVTCVVGKFTFAQLFSINKVRYTRVSAWLSSIAKFLDDRRS